MPQTNPSVLIVEDEPAQREVLAYNFEAQGFRVSQSDNGEEALLLVAEETPDLIVLDWMLPNVSGIEICRRLKSRPETKGVPIIMLSARSEEVDLVRGLETGADDYIVKPYSVAELMARVRTQLRRTRPASQGEVLEFEDITLDATTHRVHRGGIILKLGPTEFRLLRFLMTRPDRVLTRQALLDGVWGDHVFIEERTVDVHVRRLRLALEPGGFDALVETVRGGGYRLRKSLPR